jgi:hypothetical protein
MAKDSSFDVVSQIDLQEVRNAVDQTLREISQRFDFKNTGSHVELATEGEASAIRVRSNTEQKSWKRSWCGARCRSRRSSRARSRPPPAERRVSR